MLLQALIWFPHLKVSILHIHNSTFLIFIMFKNAPTMHVGSNWCTYILQSKARLHSSILVDTGVLNDRRVGNTCSQWYFRAIQPLISIMVVFYTVEFVDGSVWQPPFWNKIAVFTVVCIYCRCSKSEEAIPLYRDWCNLGKYILITCFISLHEALPTLHVSCLSVISPYLYDPV